MNQEITRTIDQYLSNGMSEVDRVAFEEQLKISPELHAELELQQNIVEGIKRSVARLKITKIKNRYHRIRFFKFGAISLVTTIILAAIGYYIYKSIDKKQGKTTQIEALVVQNFDAPLKEVNVDSLSIYVDPTIKQIARFDNGVNIEIPSDAFIDGNGEVVNERITLSLKTYNTAAKIVASGIPMTYHHNGNISNFVSAGMFDLSGSLGDVKVYIKEGKDLIVNYPTETFGDDFDFFHFEEIEEDSVRRGIWKKLSCRDTINVSGNKILDTFKLQFASEDYPELAPLSTIDWKLGTIYRNPKNAKNKWVLEEKWTSIEISQPKYGLVEDLLNAKGANNNERFMYNAVKLTKDESRIIIFHNTTVKIFSKNGRLIKSIDKVRKDRYEPFKVLAEKYLIIKRSKGDDIFTLDGELLGRLPNSHNHYLSKSNELIVYEKYDRDFSIYISETSGKEVVKIKVEENLNEPNLYGINGSLGRFLLTPKDELILIDTKGVSIYNLDGFKIKHKNGKYEGFKIFEGSKLILEKLNGTLTIWDYENDVEIKSNRDYFDLREHQAGDGWPHPNYIVIRNSPYVLINQDTQKHSLLWNYQTNSILELSIYIPNKYYQWDKLPENMLEGYNLNNDSYHLYDVNQNKEILSVPNTSYYSGDGIGMQTSISQDKYRILLENDKKSPLYYHFKDGLIIDFKQFDSLIYTAGFIDNERVFTISKNGIYRIWDKKGNELSSRKLQEIEHDYAYEHDDKINSYNYLLNARSFHDWSGNLLINNGFTYVNNFLDDKILSVDKNNVVSLSPTFKLDLKLYQLIVKTKKKDFITYVYLNDDDLLKINKYYSSLVKRINKEKNREERELRMIRRFKINQFGLYNWDKLMKEERLLTFEADFDFGVPTEFSDISVYLITDLDGKAVIRYSEKTWKDFMLSPDLPNKLIAVLPDNKMAIFDKEDFEKVDFEKVAKEKYFKFDMRVIDQSIVNLSDLKEVIQ